MKNVTRFSVVGLVALVVMLFVVDDAVAKPAPPVPCQQPVYGTANIDGSASEWQSGYFFAPMYRAGNPNKDILSNAYVLYDCTSKTLYVYVAAADFANYPILDEYDTGEINVSVGGTRLTASAFARIGATTYTTGEPVQTLDVIEGWEASFPYDPGTFPASDLSFNVHNNVWDEEEYQDGQPGSQTSRSVEPNLCLTCPVGVDLQFFDAYQAPQGVKVEWSVANEINHAGYNIYRSGSEFGVYTKITPNLIMADVMNPTAEKHYQFVDKNVMSGSYFYKLEGLSLDGGSEFHGPIRASVTTSVADKVVPTEYALEQNYPNPFNPTTTINFSLPAQENVVLDIYNMQGAKVRSLVNSVKAIGAHSVVWNATNDAGQLVPSGVYIYRISAGSFTKTSRMILLK